MTTQAIILDIDGTLLNDDKKILTRNKKRHSSPRNRMVLNLFSHVVDQPQECTYMRNN